MPPIRKPTVPKLTPAERADRCAVHRASTSPSDAESFRLLGEILHTVEDLSATVTSLAQALEEVVTQLSVVHSLRDGQELLRDALRESTTRLTGLTEANAQAIEAIRRRIIG